MNASELLGIVRTLDLPLGHYVVTGSGPLAVRGIREAADIDIQVDDELWEQLQARYGGSDDAKTLALATGVDAHRDEPFPDAPGLPDQIQSADSFDGIAFVNLEHTKLIKRAKGRPKDFEDVRLIEAWQSSRDR